MREWKTYKLGEICKNIAYGYTESASSDVVGPKFLRITDIQYDFISWDKVPYCPITVENHKKYKLELGDIVIARTGASTGATAIFKDEEIDAVFASYLIRYKIDKEIAYPFYIGQLLKSALWRSYVSSIIGGSAQPGANAKQFADFKFLLPDLSTQIQIAQILTSLNDKIELNLQMNQTLEAMAQALFKEWFINFNFPNFDGELENGLPKGWRMGVFEELTDIKTGKGLKRTEFKPDGIYPIIGANGELGRTDEYLLDDKLLLTGRVGTLGSIKISHGKKWYSDNVLIMKPYKYFYFSYFNLKTIDMNSLNRGSTQPLVTQTDLKNYLTLIPSEEILLLFEKTVNEIFEKIFFNDIQIQTLTQTRNTLLPKLMSGKLEIKN